MDLRVFLLNSALPCAALLAAAAPAAPPPGPSSRPPAQEAGDEVAASYRKLADAQDEAGLAKLWREHPDLVLVTIDADLEGSLALRERSRNPDESAIAAMHARALRGARAAVAAGLHPILADYAAAFTGWDATQQKQFRAGQAAFGKAHAAAKDGRHDEALAAANECVALAEPLGDWWGTAMGFSVTGDALSALGRHDEALVALGRARALHHDLGLSGAEYGNLRAMVEALRAQGGGRRLQELARQGALLGRALGDAAGAALLEELSEGR
ncbi:MAG TPA: hypothetical protein VFD43_07990 [Planctomycetota bacterium]|nr:hypothetical protein [Planctomycetota bacterium]